MSERRQRLAWAVLLAGFLSCIGLVVLFPLAFNSVMQSARRALDVTVQANQGTVGLIQGENETIALFTGQPAQEISAGSAVLTNATDQALMLMTSPDGQDQAMRVQVYGNSHVRVDEATTPRFSTSSAHHRIELVLNSGRLLIGVPEDTEREVDVHVSTPQGGILINRPGSYSISSSNLETQVAVFQGQLTASTSNSELVLNENQRASLAATGDLSGPFGNELNLITNGDFSQGLEEWVQLAANIEIADQPDVNVAVEDISNEPALVFERVGLGHADASVRQIVGKDVTDYTSLRVVVSMEIAEQSLGVCGQQGSECPLILRVEYVDINGVDQTWQQGFYSVGNIGTTTPDVCVTCLPPLNEHQRVPYRQLVFYESENLMEKLQLLDIQPRTIKSLTLIASGHSFDSRVVDVALIAQE